MELPVINIYCDESCHLENDKHTSMVLGGVSCPISKVRDISVKIKELKEKYGNGLRFLREKQISIMNSLTFF